ncbi:unnamed protein product [Spirodela intermedia]|uniref:BHLH domain-containing protein n=1 Tax=Spirodela intermedia TaxID=51605 RepID=A0A7I8JKG9_SPIIN|nr:unnamed protein product [Spirodela intermedia]CAA6670677.1 unnamed protein product [Spirodela intermedia]
MDLGEKEKFEMERRNEENPLGFHGYMAADSFRPRLWDQPTTSQNSPFCDATRGPSLAAPPRLEMGWNAPDSIPRAGGGAAASCFGLLPQSRPQFPDDPGFIERAARFSNFSSFLPNTFRVNDPAGIYGAPPPPPQKGEAIAGETSQSAAASVDNGFNGGSPQKGRRDAGGEPEFSGGALPETPNSDNTHDEPPSKGPSSGAKKRKRGNQETETDQGRAETQFSGETSQENADGKQRSEPKSSSPAGKGGGKNSVDGGGEAPKEDYIHVRARRGQATNSHSLAERLRREKISERMKFLQDLVPGCSKVTGKAVMLDEIINYVQSLQRQVELATVNPRLDFNIESLLSKEMLQPRGISSSSFDFSPELAHPQLHPPQQGLIQSGIPGLGNSSDLHRRSMNAQLTANQMPGAWDEELHHVIQMGFGGSTHLGVQDLHGESSHIEHQDDDDDDEQWKPCDFSYFFSALANSTSLPKFMRP